MAPRRLRILGIGNARSRHLTRWAQRLAGNGHEVHVASTRADVWEGELDGVALHLLQDYDRLARMRGVRRLRIVHALRELAQKLEPDVVHAHYLLPYGYWAARAGLQPLVVSPWGTDILVDAKQGGRAERWSRSAIASGRVFVVNSDPLARAVVELGGDPRRVRRIQWHADISGFSPEHADRSQWERRGWPSDSLVVLSLRNFRPDTNLDVLIRAFARAVETRPDARLLLAARAGPTRADIEALVNTLGLTDLVAFETVSPAELAAVVASADIAISLANSDSSPASLLESMASGLPLVVGVAASIDEWVAQDDGAVLVAPRDTDAVAAALLRLAREPDLRRRYGERNARVVRERFGDPAAELERAYAEALADSPIDHLAA